MRVNKIFPPSGYKSWWLSLPSVFCLATLMFVMGFWMSAGGNGFASANGFWLPDSSSYAQAADTLLKGDLDLLRTPVYPLIIALLRAIVGPVYTYKALLLVQFIFFLISGILLREIAAKFTGSIKTGFWISSIYLLFPGHIVTCVNIMTESFSVSGVVVLLWCLMRRYPKFPTWIDGILSGLVLAFLIYLRPIFLYLIPVVFVYYLVLLIREKKDYRFSFSVGCAMLAVIVASLFVYQHAMTKKYGIHAITMVNIVNNFSTAKEGIGMHPELASTEELHDLLEEVEAQHNMGACDDAVALMPYYLSNPVLFEGYTNRLLRYSPKDVLKHVLFERTPAVVNSKLFISYTRFPFNLIEMFNPTMHVYFAVIVWFLVFFVFYVRRSGSLPPITSLLLMITLGITFTSIIGAMGDWPRLNMPGIPAFLLIAGKLCTFYRLRITKSSHRSDALMLF